MFIFLKGCKNTPIYAIKQTYVRLFKYFIDTFLFLRKNDYFCTVFEKQIKCNVRVAQW